MANKAQHTDLDDYEEDMGDDEMLDELARRRKNSNI